MAETNERKVQTIQAQPAVTHEPVPAQNQATQGQAQNQAMQGQGAGSRSDDQSPLISGGLVRVGEHTDVRYLNEQEEARERLKASVNRLTEQASLQLQVQKEPLKMLGGASAVGAVIGLVLGRQLRRSKKVYVDAHSPVKHQRDFVKAQKKAQQDNKNNVGGALFATLGTLAVRMLADKVLAPKLEQVASGLLDKAGQPKDASAQASKGPGQSTEAATARPASNANAVAAASTASQIPAANRTGAVAHSQQAPAQPAHPAQAQSSHPAQQFAQPQGAQPQPGVHYTANPVHVGVVPIPDSVVEAKAQGTPISEDQKANPNLS